MKKVLLKILSSENATLLIALAIGLGIAVHEVFFLVALIVAIAALVQGVVSAIGEKVTRIKMMHRYP